MRRRRQSRRGGTSRLSFVGDGLAPPDKPCAPVLVSAFPVYMRSLLLRLANDKWCDAMAVSYFQDPLENADRAERKAAVLGLDPQVVAQEDASDSGGQFYRFTLRADSDLVKRLLQLCRLSQDGATGVVRDRRAYMLTGTLIGTDRNPQLDCDKYPPTMVVKNATVRIVDE